MTVFARFLGKSLKVRLGLGAALLGVGTFVTALILWFGMQEVSKRLDSALASETRMARYSTLSQQASTFLVVATEAIQTELPADVRMDRMAPVTDQLRATFKRLHQDVRTAVEDAESIGLDAQARYGTQSLGLARMEAMLASTLDGLRNDTPDKARLRAYVDTFANSFDPLLSQAVNTEVLFRNEALAGIADLQTRLTRIAVIIAVMTILAVALFYFGLIRPQFRRLDGLRAAAKQIGRADFAVALPAPREDEIGQLYSETNRMAKALSVRETQVQTEWGRLNETIAERTEALQTANATLAEVDENRKRFFADVSHELRTPLTVILMEAQIGLKATGDGAFATIETRAARLNQRIDDLLRVARSDSGQLALDAQDVSLSDLIKTVATESQAEVDNAGMALQVEDTPNVTLRCDPNWIRQVLVSLIRNAIRHARSGQHIRLSALMHDDMVELAIADNGPGIAPEDQARIFERFAQGGTENAQGFGVGLALARWVIEEHDGSIALTSPLPRDAALGSAPGTKVAVRLPLKKA